MFSSALSKIHINNTFNKKTSRIFFNDIDDEPIKSSEFFDLKDLFPKSNNNLYFNQGFENKDPNFEVIKSVTSNIFQNNHVLKSATKTCLIEIHDLHELYYTKEFFEYHLKNYGETSYLRLFTSYSYNITKVLVSWTSLGSSIFCFENFAKDLKDTCSIEIASIKYISDSLVDNENIIHFDSKPLIYVHLHNSNYNKNLFLQSDIDIILYETLNSIGEILSFKRLLEYPDLEIYECQYLDNFNIIKAKECLNSMRINNDSILVIDYDLGKICCEIQKLNNENIPETLMNHYSLRFSSVLTDETLSSFNSLKNLNTLIVTKNKGVEKDKIIDLVKIYKKLDLRTTIMIRNIPNKIDQGCLKSIIDQTNKNSYGFLYLRIDFNTKRNVGYAFICFNKAEDIITFAKAKVGKKWEFYGSEKYCDICYAEVQGIDNLIEKFRNSTVMKRPNEYRPKLYYTSGDLKGHERKFPSPNKNYYL